MANGSYQGRGDPRRGRGRNDGPPGRSYRGGRGGRGPQGMSYGAPPMDAPSNLMATNQRNNDFPRDAARPRMATDGTAQGQGRGAPFGRGNARGGGAHRGRGGRTASTAQKVAAPKAGGQEASSGKLLSAVAPKVTRCLQNVHHTRPYVCGACMRVCVWVCSFLYHPVVCLYFASGLPTAFSWLPDVYASSGLADQCVFCCRTNNWLKQISTFCLQQ